MVETSHKTVKYQHFSRDAKSVTFSPGFNGAKTRLNIWEEKRYFFQNWQKASYCVWKLLRPQDFPIYLNRQLFWAHNYSATLISRSNCIVTHYVSWQLPFDDYLSIWGTPWVCLLLHITQSLPTNYLVSHFQFLLSHVYKNNRTQKTKLQKVQQSVRESSGHKAAEMELAWDGIGGWKLIGNDSKCLEGGHF